MKACKSWIEMQDWILKHSRGTNDENGLKTTLHKLKFKKKSFKENTSYHNPHINKIIPQQKHIKISAVVLNEQITYIHTVI